MNLHIQYLFGKARFAVDSSGECTDLQAELMKQMADTIANNMLMNLDQLHITQRPYEPLMFHVPPTKFPLNNLLT